MPRKMKVIVNFLLILKETKIKKKIRPVTGKSVAITAHLPYQHGFERCDHNLTSTEKKIDKLRIALIDGSKISKSA